MHLVVVKKAARIKLWLSSGHELWPQEKMETSSMFLDKEFIGILTSLSSNCKLVMYPQEVVDYTDLAGGRAVGHFGLA